MSHLKGTYGGAFCGAGFVPKRLEYSLFLAIGRKKKLAVAALTAISR